MKNIINILSLLILTSTFSACQKKQSKFLKTETSFFKEIWENDPCGKSGNREVVAHIMVEAFEKKKLNISTVRYITGKPAKIDTLKNQIVRYSYIVSADTKHCDTMAYNDVVRIGMVVFFDNKKNKIIDCHTNLY